MGRPVLLSTLAQKQFMRLDAHAKDRVRKGLERLASGGRVDTKRLVGIKGREDLFRLQVGDYRIVYRADPDAIRVVQTFHRRQGYDWL